MQDAQQGQLDFVRASRDARIDALPVSDRVRRLLRAVDRILVMLIEAGAANAYLDDGQTLVGEIDVDLIAEVMSRSRRTALAAIAEARDGPYFDAHHDNGKLSVYAIHWLAIPELHGSPVAPVQELHRCSPDLHRCNGQSAPVQHSISESPSPTDPQHFEESMDSSGEVDSRESGGVAGDGPRAGVIWGERLTVQQLREPGELAVLFATALEQRVIGLDDMSLADWFAWARYCVTVRGVANPVGIFTSQLVKQDRFGKTWREKVRAGDRVWAERELKRGIGPKQAQAVKLAVERAARRSPHAKKRIVGAQSLGDLI